MLYRNQSYEDLQKFFDKQFDLERKKSKSIIYYKNNTNCQFKNKKRKTWEVIDEVVKKYQGRSIDKALKYIHLNLTKNRNYYQTITQEFYSRIYKKHRYYQEFIIDSNGIILTEQQKKQLEDYWKHRTVKTIVTYKGVNYTEDTLISHKENEFGISETWIKFEKPKKYREGSNAYLHTQTIFKVKDLNIEPFNRNEITEEFKESYIKLYGLERGINHFNTYIEKNPNYIDYLIEVKKENLIKEYNQRLEKELDFNFKSLSKKRFKAMRRYGNYTYESRLYTVFGETFEQLPVKEVIEYNPPKEKIVKNKITKKLSYKLKGQFFDNKHHKNVTLYTHCNRTVTSLNDLYSWEKKDYTTKIVKQKIKSVYKSSVIETPIITKTVNKWTDTRKKEFIQLQNKEQKENQLTMERLGFDENSFKTPTHIYRQIRNEGKIKRESQIIE